MCGDVCESTMHAIRDCQECVQVWKSLVPSNLMLEFFSTDLKSWIRLNLDYSNKSIKNWRNIWIIACHTLWTWRNQAEHEENFIRPHDPVNHILRRSEECSQAMQLLKSVNFEGAGNKLLGWKPPTRGMIKLNTDVASRKLNVAGCGGVLRDEFGRWQGGFSKYVRCSSAILAEMWGVYEGIKLLNRLGYKHVEINTDSLEVVTALEQGAVCNVDCVAILRQILQQLKMLNTVIISHTYRDANACADALANHGCNNKRYIFFDRAPDFLAELLELDFAEIVNPAGSLV